MTTVADMLTIRARRKPEDRESQLRRLAAELRRIPAQMPPAAPTPLHVIARRRARQATQ